MKTTKLRCVLPVYTWPHSHPTYASHVVRDQHGREVGWAATNRHPTSYSVFALLPSGLVRHVGRVPLVRDIAGRVAASR